MITRAKGRKLLPLWAETLRQKYLAGEASTFVLYRNVFDNFLLGDTLHNLQSLLVAGLGAVIAGALLFWLLATAGGRDTLLNRVLGLLPPDSLQWARVEGTVAGPLVFHDLRYDHDGVVFTARRVLTHAQNLAQLLPALQQNVLINLLTPTLMAVGIWL